MDVKLSLNSVVVITGSQVSSKMGDEGVILDFESGTYFGLDPIGFQIWEMMQDPIQVKDILVSLLQEYEVDSDQCEQEIFSLLNSLIKEGLVKAKEI